MPGVSREMRILLVNKFSYVTGGADRHCLDLAAILRSGGHEVMFLSTGNRESHEAGAFIPPTVTHAARDSLPALESVRVAGRALWNRTAYGAMQVLIARFAPDLIHLHKLYPQLSVAPVVAAARRGTAIGSDAPRL